MNEELQNNEQQLAYGRLSRLLGYLSETPDNTTLLLDIGREALAANDSDTVFMATHRLRALGHDQPEAAMIELQAVARAGRFTEVKVRSDFARDCWPDNEWVAIESAWSLYIVRAYADALARLSGIQWRNEAFGMRAAEIAVQGLWQMGRDEEALRVCEGALQRFPTSPRLLSCASALLMDAGRDADAVACAKAAAVLDDGPQIHEALPVLAAAALDAGDPSGALDWTQRALQQRDDDQRVWSLHAAALMAKPDLSRAAEALRQWLGRFPQQPDALLMLGWVAARGGDWDEVASCANHLMAIDPAQADAHALQAVVCNTMGEREEALQALQRARRLDADNVSVQCAQALLDGGSVEQLDAAVAHIRAALRPA